MDPWYDKIDKEIKSRNDKCRLDGVNSVYHVDDPYQYGSYEAFMKNHPVNLKKGQPQLAELREFRKRYCSGAKNTGMSKLDPGGRYFIKANSEMYCKQLKGKWDPTSRNRHDKFSRGMCWKTGADKECGAAVDNDFVLSRDVLSSKAWANAKTNSKSKCAALPDKCHWNDFTNERGDCDADAASEEDADAAPASASEEAYASTSEDFDAASAPEEAYASTSEDPDTSAAPEEAYASTSEDPDASEETYA
ncbi:hypothetical protein FOA52_001780 [Chlamydomonas sp. UWO 241]|nr:hypothetical protein FOA52_001780 [Chlamydomonas sp. UWO 241]